MFISTSITKTKHKLRLIVTVRIRCWYRRWLDGIVSTFYISLLNETWQALLSELSSADSRATWLYILTLVNLYRGRTHISCEKISTRAEPPSWCPYCSLELPGFSRLTTHWSTDRPDWSSVIAPDAANVAVSTLTLPCLNVNVRPGEISDDLTTGKLENPDVYQINTGMNWYHWPHSVNWSFLHSYFLQHTVTWSLLQ